MPEYGENPSREEWGARDPNAQSLSPEQWAAYQAKQRRDEVLGFLLTFGGMLGAQPLANALGIGATGAGAVSGSASVPGAVGASAAPLGGGSVTAGAMGLPSGVGAAAGGAGAGLGGAAGGGMGTAGKGILGGLSARELAAIGLSGAGTVGGYLSNRNTQNAMTPNTLTSDPNILRLLQTMQGRMDKSEPLFDSVMSMANGLLPTEYQKKGGGMG